MADYWKSNPRHYCDVCKCWFGENNISVSMHENGRRHKGNVERMLRQTRSNAARREKEEIRTAAMLAKIERDALKSLGKSKEIFAPPPVQMSTEEAQVRAELEREVEKVQIKKRLIYHSMDLANKANKEQAEKSTTASSSQESDVVPSPWQQLVSPEGYTYYYNSSTGVTQWEIPSDSALPTSSLSATTAGSSVTTTTSTTSASTHQNSVIGIKRSSGEREDADQTNLEPPSAKLVSPYGGWTTVAVRPQEIIASEEEEDEDQEGSSHDSSDNEEKEDKFKEKTAPLHSTGSPEPQVTPGTFKGFSFKKRTSTNKPQIRQRTSDFS